MSKNKISGSQAGIAGEYFVAAELSRRGYLCSVMLKNTKGVDILVSNEDSSKLIGVQVKTNNSSRKSWLLSQKNEGQKQGNFVYAFVNLVGLGDLPEYYIVSSNDVAEQITQGHKEWLATPGKRGQQRNDTNMRMFSDLDGEFQNNWSLIDELLS
ncbi:aspartate ammonia-lyase [Vibrio cholerae]|nr:aspartate ammonia-lyase [Vibrio cholerae]